MASLFPKPIPIIGATGEFESGKTLMGLTICPGPQTLYYDFEQSGASYDELGHKRINVMEEMQKAYPNGYKPVDVYLWWSKHVKTVQPGQYKVIVLDPVTDLERGLTDWVSANPQYFGHTAAQYQKMSGIMWGDMKDHLKSLLADLSTRCETLFYTAHVGKEFEGNTATGKLKVKGKATLHELASLFVWLMRKPDARGAKPNKPSARILKSRLLVSRIDSEGELIIEQVLPPIMPVCTPKALRDAFATPAGGREIDDLERHVEDILSEEDRLRLETQRHEAERDAALAKLALAGGGPGTAGKPTAPPESEGEKWIEGAEDLAALDKVAADIAAAGFDKAVTERLRSKFKARKAILSQPPAA